MLSSSIFFVPEKIYTAGKQPGLQPDSQRLQVARVARQAEKRMLRIASPLCDEPSPGKNYRCTARDSSRAFFDLHLSRIGTRWRDEPGIEGAAHPAAQNLPTL